MPSKLYFAPVPAGNTEALKAAFAEMSGSREGQCVANRAVMGSTREYVCLQHTPQGDILIVYLEGDDPEHGRDRMVASDSEYARWIAATVNPLLARTVETRVPTVEVLADWSA
jgi:hypothetical protein